MIEQILEISCHFRKTPGEDHTFSPKIQGKEARSFGAFSGAGVKYAHLICPRPDTPLSDTTTPEPNDVSHGADDRSRAGSAPLATQIFVAALCASPLFARVLMTWDRGVAVGWVDLRGAASDVFFALVLAWLCLGWLSLAPGFGSRIPVALTTMLWALVHYAGFEHVVANDEVINISLVAYLADPTFLQGSADPSRPLALLLMVGLSVLGVWRSSRVLGRGSVHWASVWMPWVILAGVLWFWSPSLAVSGWRQQSFLEQAPERLRRAKADTAPIVDPSPPPDESSGDGNPEIEARVRAALSRDLQGHRLVPVPEGKPNVLLVFVEGASGAYLPAIAEFHGIRETVKMPKLSHRAVEQGLWATQLLIPQRQTNRGEYAVLCGDHPKLSSRQSKMSDLAIAAPSSTESRPCLPQVLKQEGYHTAYLQAAQLTFMMKDQFMAKIGFDEVLGYDDFPHAYERSGWGIDDRALYEQVLERLEAYEQQSRPWFAAVLNIGTHHPYPVPKSWGSKYGRTKRSSAFAYADDALHRLLKALEEKGMADHTLVVVISDESQGLTGFHRAEIAQEIAKNWGPMVSFGPGIEARRLDGVFVQSDAALSILDYLGLADRAPHFVGRSWFRDFQAPRHVPLANAHSGRQLWLGADGSLLICVEDRDDCEGFRLHPEKLFSAGHTRRDFENHEIDTLHAAVAASQISEFLGSLGPIEAPIQLVGSNRRTIDLSEENRSRVVANGQYLELKKGSRLHVRLAYSMPEVDRAADASEARIRMRIRRRISEPFAETVHDPLRSGEKVVLDFTFAAEEGITDLDVYLTAELEEQGTDPRLIIEHATATLELPEPGEPDPQPGIEILEYRRISADGSSEDLPWLELTPRSGSLPLHACMSGPPENLRGRGCPKGRMIRGPRSMAPGGSTVGARAILEAGGRPLRGHLEIAAHRLGSTRATKSEPFDIPPGQRREVSVTYTLKRDSKRTAIRLVLREPTEDFKVEDYRMWIRPDKESVRWISKP